MTAMLDRPSVFAAPSDPFGRFASPPAERGDAASMFDQFASLGQRAGEPGDLSSPPRPVGEPAQRDEAWTGYRRNGVESAAPSADTASWQRDVTREPGEARGPAGPAELRRQPEPTRPPAEPGADVPFASPSALPSALPFTSPSGATEFGWYNGTAPHPHERGGSEPPGPRVQTPWTDPPAPAQPAQAGRPHQGDRTEPAPGPMTPPPPAFGTIDSIVGQPALVTALREIVATPQHELRLLVAGPPGTGKSLTVEVLHRLLAVRGFDGKPVWVGPNSSTPRPGRPPSHTFAGTPNDAAASAFW